MLGIFGKVGGRVHGSLGWGRRAGHGSVRGGVRGMAQWGEECRPVEGFRQLWG